MSDCIFCKIVAGEIPSTKVYEDDKVLAFNDINPEAPVHVLVVPKVHLTSINDINEDNSEIIVGIFVAINKIVKDLGISESGYRIISNSGEDGGQTVSHLHFHIIGKKKLGIKLT